jgi:ABC-type multidrug transport system fused ATPase/permease subunit
MQTLTADADPDEADAPDAVTGEVLRRGLRLVRRYAKGQPGPLAVSVAGATVFALSAVGATAVLGWLTDELIIPAFEDEVDTSVLTLAVAALVGVTLLRAVSIVFRRYFGAMTGRRTQADLRRQVTDRYLDVPLAYHQRTPAGRLLAHAVADIEAATEVIYPLPFSVGVFALVFSSMVSLVLVDPLMALVAFVLFPTLALLNRIYTKRVEAPSARVQEQVGRVSAVAHESIDGALVVKALGRERVEVDRLATEADALRRARIEVGRLRALFEPAIDALPNVGVIVLLALGTWAIEEGRVTPGELVQAMALFGILAFPMRVLGYFLEGLPRAVVSIARVDGVLGEPAAPRPDRPRPLAAESSVGAGPLAVSVEDLAFAYEAPTTVQGGQSASADRVLDGVSFTLAPGEIVALVGATGAGKSTMAELLCGLMPPLAGTVRLDGVDLAELDPDEVHRATSLVFQEAFLFADRIGENIALGAEVSADQIAAAARIAHADAFIRRLPEGYDTVVGERGVSLSGGQRQRVALARALVRRPRLLILDDATSAVDPTVEAAILADLRATLDTTTLIVAHRVSTIELADRVLFLADGRIVASGPHRELLATVPAYEAIVRAYEAEEVA